MKEMTVYEFDKLGLEALNNKLHELQDKKDILNCVPKIDARNVNELRKVVAEIQMVNNAIDNFNLKELHSNVNGYVKETSYDQNIGFTIIVESDNKHHIYKGLYGLHLSPSDQIKMGDSLGMIKGCLFYDVSEVK